MTKGRLEDLAIFGGTPAFTDLLHVGRPNLGNRRKFMERVEDMLDRRWLTNDGPYVRELEHRIADHIGVRNCVLMCNGTVALEIAIRALELRGEVILPAFTFIATAHALQWQEITPVFCDVECDGYSIDAARVDQLITPRTSGIIGVHVWGKACDVEGLQEVAARRHLKLLFDAAHAFGCSYRNHMIGNFGNAEVFSFHATKFFNTFEGGAAVTNDDGLAQKMRFMRNFGFSGYDEVSYLGTNGKMTEIAAAMGLTSLESIEEFVAVNHRNYEVYREAFGGISGLSFSEFPETERNNFQYVIIEIDAARAGIDRDCVMRALHAENVLARRYFYPACHRMEPYRSYFPHAGLLLPVTERLAERVLSLPTGTAITAEEARTVATVLRLIVENGAAVRRHLQAHGPDV